MAAYKPDNLVCYLCGKRDLQVKAHPIAGMMLCEYCTFVHDIQDPPPKKQVIQTPFSEDHDLPLFDFSDDLADELFPKEVDTAPIVPTVNACACGRPKFLHKLLCHSCFHQKWPGKFNCTDCGWMYVAANCGGKVVP